LIEIDNSFNDLKNEKIEKESRKAKNIVYLMFSSVFFEHL